MPRPWAPRGLDHSHSLALAVRVHAVIGGVIGYATDMVDHDLPADLEDFDRWVADQNLQDTENLRLNWTNSLAVAMSTRLVLKTSYQVLFDNRPALVSVPLGDGTILTPLGKMDSVFSVAIVASF